MKKSLIALAILGTIAGSAAAQSNVTIYGVIDASIARTDTNTTESTWSLDSGNWSGSRLGFKGTEDLGNGLSANFQLENGFSVDTGRLGQGDRLFGRQAWVGLKSNAAGELRFGRQINPIHLAVDSVDPFATGLAGNAENAIVGTAIDADDDGRNDFSFPYFFGGPIGFLITNGGDVRTDNAVSYTTPNFAGFSAQVLYGFGERTGSTSDRRQVGASAGYANGPVAVTVALHTTKEAIADVDGVPSISQKSYFVGGTYDLRVVKLHAAYQDNNLEAGPADIDGKSFLLGVSAPVGAGTVLASWKRAKYEGEIEDVIEGDAKANQYSLGYTHSLSKRTTAYTSWSYQKLKVPAERDQKGNMFNVGIRHVF
jgi:predicted porin